MHPFAWLLLPWTAVSFAQHSPSLSSPEALFAQGRLQEAELELRSLLSSNCDNQNDQIEAGVLLGRVVATAGRLDEAEEAYHGALAIDPGHAPAYLALGKILGVQKRQEESEQAYRKAIELDETLAEAHLGLGRIIMEQGDLAKAEQSLARSMELDPTNARLYFDIGVLKCRMGMCSQAPSFFSKAATLNPTLDMAMVARIYVSHGALELARLAYEEALDSRPGSMDVVLAYGEVLESLREETEALQQYDKVLQHQPTNALAMTRKALILLGTGIANYGAQQACGLNIEEAMSLLSQALAADPNLSPARDALTYCETELQQMELWSQRAAEVGQKGSSASDDSHRKLQSKGGVLSKLKRTVTPPAREWVTDVGGYIEVERVAISSASEFWTEYVQKSRPVVVTNFQSHFAPPEDWSWEALSAKWKGLPVHISVSQSGRFDGPEPGALWGLGSNEEVLVRPPGATMRFEDFVNLLHAELSESFYLEYSAVHQYLGSHVTDMIKLPDLIEETELELLLTNVWIGKGGTTSVLHYDDYENLLAQVRGTKELTLFPPREIENLYYTPRRKGIPKYTYPGEFQRGELATSHQVVFSSSVFLDNPDMAKHPRFRGLRPYHVTLQPGEVLFLPVYWHHEVKSSPDDLMANIAINFWFRNTTVFAEEAAALSGGTVQVPPVSGASEL
ncbi:unnamed protein product [Chrysoparadoxa australica]